jgi:hypothetical protein
VDDAFEDGPEQARVRRRVARGKDWGELLRVACDDRAAARAERAQRERGRADAELARLVDHDRVRERTCAALAEVVELPGEREGEPLLSLEKVPAHLVYCPGVDV